MDSMRPGRRRRIFVGVFLGLLLAGLGTAAAYALSTHTTQAAPRQTTSVTSTPQITGQTGQTAGHKATTAAQTTAHHHHRHKTKTTRVHTTSTTVSTVTTQHGTTGHHHNSPKPVTISDAFAAGNINPTTWSTNADGGDVSHLEQGGQLVLTVGAAAVPSGHKNQIDVHVATQCAFPGDFDARVSYKLLEWPAGDNIYVGMNTNADATGMMRHYGSQSGDEYTSWVGSKNALSLPFSGTGGSLRIARVDGNETTYYWHGGRWLRLASSRAIGQAVIGLQAVSDGQNFFGGEELKVAFDNFKVTGAKPVCD